MMQRTLVRLLFAAGLVAAGLVTSVAPVTLHAQGQEGQRATTQPDPPAPGMGAISGRVTDAKGNPLENVLITIEGKDKDKTLSGQVITQASGMFRFNDLPPGVVFRLAFAKRDFAAEVRYNIFVLADDERRLDVAMQRNAVVLDAVKIVARPEEGSPMAKKYLDSQDLEKLNVPSLFDAINRARPMMLVGARRGEICMPPDTALTLYVNGIRRPLFDPINMDSMANSALGLNDPNQSQGISSPTLAAQQSRNANLKWIEEELRWIRPEDVQQVRYVGCDDNTQTDIPRKNVIWVVLKPGRR